MLNKLNLANTVLVGMSQSVGVRPERCNRMCHKNAKCNLCETNCPVGAIKVGNIGERIDIDWSVCRYCGICVNICPTGVYSIRNTTYKEFLDNYRGKITPEGTLHLSCQADTDSSAARLECLGILGVPDLLYLYIHGAKTIRIDFFCTPECPSRYGREILEDEMEELKNIAPYFENLIGLEIAADENGVVITFPKQFPVSAPPPKEEEESVKSTETTRRGMFDVFRENATDTLVRSAVMLTPQELPTRTPPRSTKEVPEKRQIFIETLLSCGKLLKNEMPVGGYFYNISIYSECIFCKVCTRLCPTGAIHANDDDNTIVFTAAECTSCGMCRISCYQKNIQPEKTLSLKEFFDEVKKAKSKY